MIGSGRSAIVDAWQEGQLWSKGRCEKFSGAKGSRATITEFAAFIHACRSGEPGRSRGKTYTA